MAPKKKAPAVIIAPKRATLTSWSYSVYNQYMKCPMSVMFDKVMRIRISEPFNPAFEKGNKVHKAAETYIAAPGRAPSIIEELKTVTTRLKKFRALKARVEQDWTFTRQWLPTTWNDWANGWLRIKVDVCAEEKAPPLIHITDWKTGKIHDEHKQQRSLYALGGLQLVDLGLLAKDVKKKDVKLIAEHVYTDTTQTATEEFTMKDLKPLKDEWERRIKYMMSDTRYAAKPGYHCRWCKFRASNGGPCESEQK